MPPVLILLTFLLVPGAGADSIFEPFLSEEIIAGHEAKPHSRPYMAYIEFVEEDRNRSICGGFLVRDNFVLTAAHCLGRSMKVILGAHNIESRERTQQIMRVEKAIPHPAYDPKYDINDIMLLKLRRKAMRTKAVRPLSLPRHKVNVKPGDVCSVAGWGWMTTDGKSSNTLQEVELTVQKDEECQACYGGYFYTVSQICAGDPKIKRATYYGDSGGPLLYKKMVVGIVSKKPENGTSPEIFTKVSSFLSWIKKTLKSS